MIDFIARFAHGVGVPSGTALSGTTVVTSPGINVSSSLGGTVFIETVVGAISGSPTAFSATTKAQEADTQNGTYTDIPTQDAPSVLSIANTRAAIRALPTKPWVRSHTTPAFTGGTSPGAVFHTAVLAEAQRFSAGTLPRS